MRENACELDVTDYFDSDLDGDTKRPPAKVVITIFTNSLEKWNNPY
jgi:hypothetical protein